MINSQAAAQNGKFTLVLDSSQLSTFLECPQMWNYQYNERLGLPAGEPKEAMNAGTYGHKLVEMYYLARFAVLDMNAAKEKAFAFDIDSYFCTCKHSRESHSEGGACKCGCEAFKAQPFELAGEMRYAVKNRLWEYFCTYLSNDFVPDSPEAVEVGFSEKLYEDSENLFVLEGRIDMKATLQGLPCIVDHKFQTRAHSLYKKSIQFKNYVYASRVPLLVINYIRLSKGVTKDTLVRELVTFNSLEMQAWKQELVQLFFKIKAML